MITLTKYFNKAYPVLCSSHFKGSCIVEEPENAEKDGFNELTLTGFDGYCFPHSFVADMQSFADKAQHSSFDVNNHCNVLKLNCDKVVLFELNGQKYMLFCELKSKFSLEEIAHAKDQIVGSLVKVRSLFHTLQDVNLDEYKPIGLIVSYQPSDEQISAVSKTEDKKSTFVIRLNAEKHYTMPKKKTNAYFHPLNVGTIDLFYLPVPGREKSFSVDIRTIIK